MKVAKLLAKECWIRKKIGEYKKFNYTCHSQNGVDGSELRNKSKNGCLYTNKWHFMKGCEEMKMNTRMKRVVMVFAIMSMYLVGCSPTVNKACDWCGGKPSVAYKTSDDTESYVCKECSSTCMICGDKKPKHQCENLLGMVMFVCDDCYEAN